MRSVKYLIAAGAASLLSSAAFAADMPSIMPAPQPYYAPPPVQDFGGWYLRGDIGMTNTSASKLFEIPVLNAASTVHLAGRPRLRPAARHSASASAISSTTGSALTSPVSIVPG